MMKKFIRNYHQLTRKSKNSSPQFTKKRPELCVEKSVQVLEFVLQKIGYEYKLCLMESLPPLKHYRVTYKNIMLSTFPFMFMQQYCEKVLCKLNMKKN